MIKKSMIIVVVPLVLASCAERGQPQVSKNKNIMYNESRIVKEDRNIPTLTVHAKNKSNIDNVKNKVSGGLVLLIGVLILL